MYNSLHPIWKSYESFKRLGLSNIVRRVVSVGEIMIRIIQDHPPKLETAHVRTDENGNGVTCTCDDRREHKVVLVLVFDVTNGGEDDRLSLYSVS